MLEIKKAVVPLEEQDIMTFERIITDKDEKEALVFLKKFIYDRILHSQQGKLKSHVDASNPLEGFTTTGDFAKLNTRNGMNNT